MELSKKIISSLIQIAQDRNIPTDVATNALKDALITAYTREYDGANINVNIDIDNGIVDINRIYKVVADSFADEDEFDDYIEMTLSDAQKIDANATVGSKIEQSIEFDKMPQSIVIHMAQLFKHNISSESNTRNYDA
jgi:N utilization substance protein A